MTTMNYEKPLEHYTVDNFIEECCKLLGKPVHGLMEMPTFEAARRNFIGGFAYAIGDVNPIYTDITYAVDTRYYTLIAPPTFLITFKYPISHGVLFNGPYPLVGLEAAFDWEWNDVVRMNDSFTSELILKDVYEKSTDKGRTVYLVAECKYRNKVSKELTATCHGTYAAIARAESTTEISESIDEGFRKYPITDREVYHYSEGEVERIVNDMDAEERRGCEPRYWEDVNIGDELTPIVKGPLVIHDALHYHQAIFRAKAFPAFGAQYRKGQKYPGFLRKNPVTNWPYDSLLAGHSDPHMSGASGLPDFYAPGTLRAGLCVHLLTNWMGDDGFLRRMSVDVLEPYIYGDTMWISGKVTEKYKEKLGGVLYRAVDIELQGVNQLGNDVQPGTATVYLPSLGYEVKLAIP